ncbi:hypothetical protein SGRA_3830 [Saprospira grandis str. Lewin]|uniref:Uncharacterized protein n=1 Tax=Saprospira grandis (strain Lewin) TaxID=984262 RepID=H6L5Y6_SAPGL|nr:hypothetical protein SGRA_3830 [Saprospira grandis str. Lewin]
MGQFARRTAAFYRLLSERSEPPAGRRPVFMA